MFILNICSSWYYYTKTFMIIGVVLLFWSSTNACFIRNCPKGGKRSVDMFSVESTPCLSCGPGNTGQCFGPNICCGPFGCYIGTRETHVCLSEDQRPEACLIKGEPCGSNDRGFCAADKICCDSDACSHNEKCDKNSAHDSMQLISLLNKILQTSDYD